MQTVLQYIKQGLLKFGDFVGSIFTTNSNKPEGRIVFSSVRIDKNIIIIGDITGMILTATQEVDLAINPVDKKGNPAQVDGTPVWVSSDPAVIALVVAADGLSCVAKAGKMGHAQVSVTADADLGAGVVNISGVIEFDVAASQAVSLGIVAGTPREQV